MAIKGEKRKKRRKSARPELTEVNYPDPKLEQRWETERDLDALVRAHVVEKDPERMKRCKAMAKEKLADNKKRQEEADMMVKMGQGKMDMGGKKSM